MLKPPIRDIGLPGIQKWAEAVAKWPNQFNDLSLFSCLFNTFVYIEISGTGGSAFRTMYAKFLQEAGAILNNPDLREVADIFEESARTWSEVAKSALPDSWPRLRSIRERIIEKNRYLEKQEENALGKMLKIDAEIGKLVENVRKNFGKENFSPLLSSLQRNIMSCCRQEAKAFQTLYTVMKQ